MISKLLHLILLEGRDMYATVGKYTLSEHYSHFSVELYNWLAMKFK